MSGALFQHVSGAQFAVISAVAARPVRSKTMTGYPSLWSSKHFIVWSQKWKRHLTSAGVSGKDLKEADRISRNLDVIRLAHITNRFVGLEVDQRGAKAVSVALAYCYN